MCKKNYKLTRGIDVNIVWLN